MNELRSGPPLPEDVLRAVIGDLAAEVPVTPDAYHQVRSEWIRRQRRRKRLGIILAIVAITVADAIGIWALGTSDAGDQLMFNDRTTNNHDAPAGQPIGQP